MDYQYINQLLGNVKVKLESCTPEGLEASLQESHKMPSEQQPARMSAAKKRLQNLYDKLTKNRPPHTQVQSTGAKR